MRTIYSFPSYISAESSSMPHQDPLSDVLQLLKPRTYVSAGLSAAGDWSLSFPMHEGIKFNAIVKGACWVQVEDVSPVYLEQGDCFLLTTGRSFVLSSDVSLHPTDSQPLYQQAADGIARCNGGGEFFLVGGRFGFSEQADILLGNLSAIIRIPAISDQASVLHWGLELFASEVRKPKAGGNLVKDHLAHIMLVQALREHLLTAETTRTGWLYAIADIQIGQALNAMHSNIAHPWTLSSLAKVCGMSRSAFSKRFHRRVGETAIDYLIRWRMLVAAQRLRENGSSVTAVASEVGYASESAFRAAFKRTLQSLPKRFKTT